MSSINKTCLYPSISVACSCGYHRLRWAVLLVIMVVFMLPTGGDAATAKDKYYAAERAYKKLRHNKKHQKYRDKWMACIKKYQAVYRHDPKGPWAAAGLYKSGELYLGLYQVSKRPGDRSEAIDTFERIIKKYPTSRYRKKSIARLETLSKKSRTTSKKSKAKKTKIVNPKTDPVASVIAKSRQKSKPKAKQGSYTKTSSLSTIKELRFWSNPNYTRIVIDADHEISFSHRLLKKDITIQKPQRLFIDLQKSRLRKDISKFVPINDELLSDARAGQYTHDTVRVVVDIKSFKHYKIFSLKNPFRIVLDVWGTGAGQTTAKRVATATKKQGKLSPGAIVKQLSLGVSTVVIDPGHGGKDYGAPGYLKGIHEKDITLKIAKKLASRIKKELKCKVYLTRTTDKYLSLEERTAIANTKNADLFISIHTNAARSRYAYGIETFFLNLATDDDAILVAARENATSAKNISDLESILNDLMQNAKINESSRLAVNVQESLYLTAKKKYSRIKSKGVKQAPFYVLLGAQMPAILIETSFISNPRECKRLADPHYQGILSDGIVRGIKKYIKDTNPTAFLTTPSNKNKKS